MKTFNEKVKSIFFGPRWKLETGRLGNLEEIDVEEVKIKIVND